MASKAKVSKKPPPAVAIHAQTKDGENHIVGLGNIRVLLMPEGPGWFAHGLDIDYAAQGDTVEEAKREFEDGLVATIHEHLRIHGDLANLLIPAPAEVWGLVNDRHTELKLYTTVSAHHLIRENTKFKDIDFLIAAKDAERIRRAS